MKKGDMTIQMIVFIALALIFLLVVLFVMTGKFKTFNTTLEDCTNKQGVCMSKGTCSAEGGVSSGFSCPDNQECCLNTCKGKGGTCSPSACASGKEIYLGACKNNEYCCG